MAEGQTLFDPEVVKALASNLGNKALAWCFLGDYSNLLPERRQRIIHAIHAHDDEEAAMDAILSLKITSAMVGAHDAEDRCKLLQSLVAGGNLECAGPQAVALDISVETLIAQLPRILDDLKPHLTD